MKLLAQSLTEPISARPYWIEEDAAALLCQFDYPGNIRALRNLIYELTSYVEESEPISIELVQFVLAKLNSRGSNPVTSTNGKRQASSSLLAMS